MALFTVRIQVIKVYDVRVKAADAKEAIGKVESMQSSEIAERGNLQDVTTEFPEIMAAKE